MSTMATDPRDGGTAHARLAETQALLDDARQVLLQATLRLLGTQPVWIDGERYGGLHPLDSYVQEAIAAVIEAEAAYEAAWESRQRTHEERPI